MDKEGLIQLYYKEGKTLREIGNKYGVTKQRVSQKMETLNLPRYTNKTGRPKSKIQNLDDYFEYIKQTGKESRYILWQIIPSMKKSCDECGSIENLNIHHLKYPALSWDDLQILCASCHQTKHKSGNGRKIQLKICNEYIKGKSGTELARKYKIHFTSVYHILRRWNIKTRRRWDY